MLSRPALMLFGERVLFHDLGTAEHIEQRFELVSSSRTLHSPCIPTISARWLLSIWSDFEQRQGWRRSGEKRAARSGSCICTLHKRLIRSLVTSHVSDDGDATRESILYTFSARGTLSREIDRSLRDRKVLPLRLRLHEVFPCEYYGRDGLVLGHDTLIDYGYTLYLSYLYNLHIH